MDKRAFKPDLEIPFDGKMQLGYPMSFSKDRKNFKFTSTLEFERFSRGRSSAKAIFKSGENQYEMFLADFSEIVKVLDGGKLNGEFWFVKRGANYGVQYSEKT